MVRVLTSNMRFSFLWALSCIASQAAIGIFEDQAGVGSPARPGQADHRSADSSYLIRGGGSNMWFSADAFHFVWKKVSGDVSLAADIEIPPSDGDPHRKAVLIIRQSLDADSAYADAAVHGDGLTSL